MCGHDWLSIAMRLGVSAVLLKLTWIHSTWPNHPHCFQGLATTWANSPGLTGITVWHWDLDILLGILTGKKSYLVTQE